MWLIWQFYLEELPKQLNFNRHILKILSDKVQTVIKFDSSLETLLYLPFKSILVCLFAL